MSDTVAEGSTANLGGFGPSRKLLLLGWVLIGGVLAGLAIWHLAAARHLAGELGLPLDDGWIHARFAQNIARGYGFSFNPGEATSTTTSPLWTLLLALGYRLTGEHLFTGIALNYVLAVGVCAIVYSLAAALTSNRWLGLATGLVCAATAPLSWWMLSGMEPLLYAFLALFAILRHVRYRDAAGARSLLPTVVFALAGLARPEMLLLFPLALADELVGFVRDGRGGPVVRWLRKAAPQLLVFTVLVAPLFVYNLRVTGYALPTSFYSKLQRVGIPGALIDERVGWLSALVAGPAQELWQHVVVWAKDNCLLILPFFVGWWWLTRQGLSRDPRDRGSLLVPAVLAIQPVVWALVGGYRDPAYQSQRYIANLVPLYILVGMVGAWRLGTRLSASTAQARRPAKRRRKGRHREASHGGTSRASVGLGLSLVFVVAALAAAAARQPASVEVYAKNVRDTTEMQVRIGRWLRDHVEGSALLCVNDIGAIGYLSDMPVLDLQGLVTPEVLPLRSMARRLDGTGPSLITEFVIAREPDYVVIFPQWYPFLSMRQDLFTPVFEVMLPDNITNGSNLMVVYRTVWADVAETETESDQ